METDRPKLKQVLMDRDGISEEEAQSLIDQAQEDLMRRIEDPDEGDPFEVTYDWFGLEPDYLDELGMF